MSTVHNDIIVEKSISAHATLRLTNPIPEGTGLSINGVTIVSRDPNDPKNDHIFTTNSTPSLDAQCNDVFFRLLYLCNDVFFRSLYLRHYLSNKTTMLWHKSKLHEVIIEKQGICDFNITAVTAGTIGNHIQVGFVGKAPINSTINGHYMSDYTLYSLTGGIDGTLHGGMSEPTAAGTLSITSAGMHGDSITLTYKNTTMTMNFVQQDDYTNLSNEEKLNSIYTGDGVSINEQVSMLANTFNTRLPYNPRDLAYSFYPQDDDEIKLIAKMLETHTDVNYVFYAQADHHRIKFIAKMPGTEQNNRNYSAEAKI